MLLSTFKRAGLALLALLAMASMSFAEDITFTGEVTYRERIALPPDAELWITLVNMSGGAPIASAAAELPTKGQVPLQFTLNVRSTVIKPDRFYGLTAEIRSGGRVVFSSAEPVHVDAVAPAPTRILVTTANAKPQEPPVVVPPVETPNPLLGTAWSVTSIGSDPVIPNSKVTFSIAADLRTGGNGGCNNYFTEASFEGALSFGPVAGTRMACAPEIMAQEGRLFTALAATAGYELAGDTLKLIDPAGVALVGLVRAK
ncbi:META domain-containing protein [Devosia sp. 2618]|uniref:META domain-containing protein n=1 Tax=Devosia sp. 2618 TaxID=3156454 RepID=UPI003394D91F